MLKDWLNTNKRVQDNLLTSHLRTGDVLKVPGDPLDDVADDARYGIYTFITSTEKPREVVLRETLAPILETVQDTSLSEAERRAAATSVLLRRQQIMAVLSMPVSQQPWGGTGSGDGES